jgi:hypothetical protein
MYAHADGPAQKKRVDATTTASTAVSAAAAAGAAASTDPGRDAGGAGVRGSSRASEGWKATANIEASQHKFSRMTETLKVVRVDLILSPSKAKTQPRSCARRCPESRA